MAQFCEGCPDRGNCAEDIASAEVVSSATQAVISADGRSASISVERGNPIGPTDTTVLYVDTQGGTSKPITFHGNSGADAEYKAFAYPDSIGRCTEPKVKKFLGFVVKRECSAP